MACFEAYDCLVINSADGRLFGVLVAHGSHVAKVLFSTCVAEWNLLLWVDGLT